MSKIVFPTLAAASPASDAATLTAIGSVKMIFFLAKNFADIIPKKNKSITLTAGANNKSLIKVISGETTANKIIIAKHVSQMLNIE